MAETIPLDRDQQRRLIAVQYLNASEAVFAGLQQERERNTFHFIISLRSFIEYTRRGMWFLCWADQEKVKAARTLTFNRPGSPTLVKMDEMINEALGKGKISYLMAVSPGIDEPFLNCLHALTHGNPIAVRMLTFGLDKVFTTDMLLARAETDLNYFRIPMFRRMLGEKQEDIFRKLGPIHNRPAEVKANMTEAVVLLEHSGKAEQWLNLTT